MPTRRRLVARLTIAALAAVAWALTLKGQATMASSRFGAGNDALEAAVLADDRAAIARAIAAGADPNARDAQQVTPLMLAVDRLKRQAVAELLARGANPNLKAIDGNSAVSLAIASYREAPDLMVTVIRGGGDPNIRTVGDEPVMMRFILDKNCKMLADLKALGASVDVLNRSESPLVLATALSSDWDMTWCLLELGAKYDYPPGPPEHNLSQQLARAFPSPDSPIYPFKVKVRDFLRSKGLPAPALAGDAAVPRKP